MGDVAYASMRALAGTLSAAGLAGVCISPGSRSTPLALAFAPGVSVHLDERSAAFVALGMAKATGLPAVCVCTSGTAAANYLPAVVEASRARVPLLVLTADRPPELRGTGANQTIDQVGLYGGSPRLFVDAPVPVPGDERSWAELGARAWAASMGPVPGPVHLNLPFREPLVPTSLAAAPAPSVEPPAVEAPASTLARDLPALMDVVGTARGAIVAGGMVSPAMRVADLADALGWPLIAEPTSGMRLPGRALSAGQSLLPSFEPDVVLQFGTAPTTRAALWFVARAHTLITVDPHGFPQDPAGHAALAVTAAPDDVAAELLARVSPRSGSGWLEDWRGADARARAALDAFLDGVDEPFEPRIARDVAALVPDDAVLFIGNSTPVRDLDATMAPRALRVLANRGASGIDGCVSTALGIAATGVRTVALLGDLAMLHDVGSLMWSGSGVTFVVINNGGGGIFDLLPDAPMPEHERLFITPHRASFEDVAHAARIPYVRAREPVLEPGIVEIEVDRARGLELRAAMRETVARALE